VVKENWPPSSRPNDLYVFSEKKTRCHYQKNFEHIPTFPKTAYIYRPRSDVMILKIFLLKYLAEKISFFANSTASFCKDLITTLLFLGKRQFFRRK
jgi:hypothetical protein